MEGLPTNLPLTSNCNEDEVAVEAPVLDLESAAVADGAAAAATCNVTEDAKDSNRGKEIENISPAGMASEAQSALPKPKPRAKVARVRLVSRDGDAKAGSAITASNDPQNTGSNKGQDNVNSKQNNTGRATSAPMPVPRQAAETGDFAATAPENANAKTADSQHRCANTASKKAKAPKAAMPSDEATAMGISEAEFAGVSEATPKAQVANAQKPSGVEKQGVMVSEIHGCDATVGIAGITSDCSSGGQHAASRKLRNTQKKRDTSRNLVEKDACCDEDEGESVTHTGHMSKGWAFLVFVMIGLLACIFLYIFGLSSPWQRNTTAGVAHSWPTASPYTRAGTVRYVRDVLRTCDIERARAQAVAKQLKLSLPVAAKDVQSDLPVGLKEQQCSGGGHLSQMVDDALRSA